MVIHVWTWAPACHLNLGNEGHRLQSCFMLLRCVGHISWRAADAGLDQMGSMHKDLLAMVSYLHDGGTFRRLQAIATQPLASNGLALFGEQTPEFVAVFGQALGHVLESRPETASHFLAWLVPREAVLVKLVAKDLTERALGDGANVALAALQDGLGRVKRAVNLELLERCLFLFRFGKSHTCLSSVTTLEDLLKRCLRLIGSLEIDENFLKRFGVSRDELVAQGCPNTGLPHTSPS